MSQSRLEALLSAAIHPSTVTLAGVYTKPPTWGVYKITEAERSATKRYRIGNHPVRLQELTREVGAVSTIAIFTARELAVELAEIYNRGEV